MITAITPTTSLTRIQDHQDRRPEADGGARGAVLAEHAGTRLDLGRREIAALADHHEQFFDQPAGGGDLGRLTGERHLVAADVHAHRGVLLLDRAEQPVLGAEEAHHGDPVDEDPGLDRRFGRERTGGQGRHGLL